jgi:shikimate dehydrogenase
MTVQDQVNALSDSFVSIPADTPYAAILGLMPSKGARSPALWNAAFESLSVDTRMIPIDVSEQNILAMLKVLEGHPNFVGGAIAAPHKEIAANFCVANLTAEAASIGAINCLFRNSRGALCGTNTDGEGSLTAFESAFGDVSQKRILILGSGGTGKAVAAYFASRLDSLDQLIISSRSNSALILAKKLGCNSIGWSDIENEVSQADVIINCTSLGSSIQPGLIPLEKRAFEKIKANTTIYDVVYDPSETPFLLAASSFGLSCLNGLAMNFEQVVIGFHYAATNGRNNLSVDEIRLAMNSAIIQ